MDFSAAQAHREVNTATPSNRNSTVLDELRQMDALHQRAKDRVTSQRTGHLQDMAAMNPPGQDSHSLYQTTSS